MWPVIPTVVSKDLSLGNGAIETEACSDKIDVFYDNKFSVFNFWESVELQTS